MALASPFISSATDEMAASEAYEGGRLVRTRRSMPNWSLWASDFYGWLQELRAQAGYDALQDLARTYWAHFPIASYLGYETQAETGFEPDEY